VGIANPRAQAARVALWGRPNSPILPVPINDLYRRNQPEKILETVTRASVVQIRPRTIKGVPRVLSAHQSDGAARPPVPVVCAPVCESLDAAAILRLSWPHAVLWIS